MGSRRPGTGSAEAFVPFAETARGFEFLGYHISPTGLRVAAPTLLRFVERATRLYEQGRKSGGTASRLGTYVRRWVGWARLAGVPIDDGGPLLGERAPPG